MKTDDLIKQLKNTTSFERVMERCESEFIEADCASYLNELMQRYGVSKKELIIRANLERGYAYQIIRGERAPSRDRLIQLAIGVGATLDETQILLKRGGKNELYPRVKRDAALIFCIEKRYSIIDTQLFLSERNLPLLKE